MPKKPIKETIHAKGIDIGIYTHDFQNEFISLADIAKYRSDDSNATICNWMRNRDTLEFLGLWESLHNLDFTMSPSKWINNVSAMEIVSKVGRYGRIYAHSDIAFEFASWLDQ